MLDVMLRSCITNQSCLHVSLELHTEQLQPTFKNDELTHRYFMKARVSTEAAERQAHARGNLNSFLL